MSRNEVSLFNTGFDLLDPFFEDDFFRDPFVPQRKHEDALLKTDVIEKENGYELIMDVPGLNKEDVSIEVEDGYLTITATKKSNDEEKNKKFVRKERSYYQAKRTFYVGNIEESSVKAKLEKGELHIDVPKEEEKKVAKTTISIE